jgi:hypothetical protein
MFAAVVLEIVHAFVLMITATFVGCAYVPLHMRCSPCRSSLKFRLVLNPATARIYRIRDGVFAASATPLFRGLLHVMCDEFMLWKCACDK